MPILRKFRLGGLLFAELAAGKARFQQYCLDQLTERTGQGVKAGQCDLFHYLLKAKDPETGKGFGTQELWGETRLVISAGRYPHVYAPCPASSIADYIQIHSLSEDSRYLTMCIASAEDMLMELHN